MCFRRYCQQREMQVCLTKIFLVEHQILHNMRQNRETLFQIIKRRFANPWGLDVLYIFDNIDSAYQKSNIKSNRSDIRWRKWERKGNMEEGRTVQFILLRFITRRELTFVVDPITIRKRFISLYVQIYF